MKFKIKDNATISELNEIGIKLNIDYMTGVCIDENNLLCFRCSDGYYNHELENVAEKIYKLTKADLLEVKDE